MIACPGCRAPMARRVFERKPAGTVDLDLCHPCHLIWFDQYESAALTPGAVIELFRAIHAEQEGRARPVPEICACPKCRRVLSLTHDMHGTNRFTYLRCPGSCGRLTNFFQFLREKHFVRSLAPVEVARLRAQVAQVRCSSCGAPLDLERETACRYCRAPVSILDADAVRKTLAQLSDRERERRRPVDPVAAVDAVLNGARARRRIERVGNSQPYVSDGRPDTFDLVSEALDFLMQQID